jgi:phosphatidylglycerophosphate synthase
MPVSNATPTSNAGPTGWKRRLEDPTNTFYRYRVARPIALALVHTPITPNQVSMVQPFLAAIAGWLITFDDWPHLAAGALLFEVRSILDCVDGTLAREKKMSSPSGHAIDAMCDWLGVVLLYLGIFWHFHLHPPTLTGSFSQMLGVNGVLALALFQGGVRSFSSDYFKTKYVSIFERGTDETIVELRKKVGALGEKPSIWSRLEVFIGRMGHLSFEHEWFDPKRFDQAAQDEQAGQVARREGAPFVRFLGKLWSVSNGDMFLTLVVLSIFLNQMWLGQVFFASVGTLWISTVLVLNTWFVKSSSTIGRSPQESGVR